MSNQVVQLIDKDNNNIYPVAGALKQGSVTTSTIDDGAVTAAKVDFTGFSGNYSTLEKDTKYTWIDGKTIYKKTIEFGSLPNNTNKGVDHNITNLDKIIAYEAIAIFPTVMFPLPFNSPSDLSAAIQMTFSSTQVTLTTGNNRSTGNAFITLYYTKTS